MKILYLYAEVMGYTMATITELAKHGVEVHVVSFLKNKKTAYQTVDVSGVHFYSRDSFGYKSLIDLAIKIDPCIVVVSGWMDRDYLKVASFLRRNRKLVVCGMDGQGTALFANAWLELSGYLDFLIAFIHMYGLLEFGNMSLPSA